MKHPGFEPDIYLMGEYIIGTGESKDFDPVINHYDIICRFTTCKNNSKDKVYPKCSRKQIRVGEGGCLHYEKDDKCPNCGGTGNVMASASVLWATRCLLEKCSECGGSGQIG